MLRFLVFFGSSFLVLFASAQSARRLSNENWITAADREVRSETRTINIPGRVSIMPQGVRFFAMGHPEVAFSHKRNWLDIDKNLIPEWPQSIEKLFEVFKQLRDIRFFKTVGKTEFMRRLTWLYPDDGCFLRADWMDRIITKWGHPAGSKIFAFGDLKIKTENSPDGSVEWWYHVAVAFKKADQVYVFDAAIEPQRPLLVEEWIERMSSKPQDVSISICHHLTPSPFSHCINPDPRTAEDLDKKQVEFLKREWARVLELKKNPEKVLGEEPPWLFPNTKGNP